MRARIYMLFMPVYIIMRKTTFSIFLPALILCYAISVFGQNNPLPAEAAHERDPFIPLADEKGELRKIFQKPSNEIKIPEVKLMGISKINNAYYAIMEGVWLKVGDTVKELIIKKIDAEKVTLLFGKKEFELKLNAEKK